MNCAYIIALNLLLNILFYIPAVHAIGPLPTRYTQTLKVEASKSLYIPAWVTNIPKHGFVGISNPWTPLLRSDKKRAFHLRELADA